MKKKKEGFKFWRWRTCLLCAVFIFIAGMLGGILWDGFRQARELWGINKDCALCRLRAEGRLRAKDGSGLGILQLHTGRIVVIDDFGSKKKQEGVSVSLLYSGDSGSTVMIEGIGKNVSEMNVYLSGKSVWDEETAKNFLCADCMEELLSASAAGKEEGAVRYDVALVDLESGQVFQLMEGVKVMSMEDYYIHFDYYDERVGVVIAYAPVG